MHSEGSSVPHRPLAVVCNMRPTASTLSETTKADKVSDAATDPAKVSTSARASPAVATKKKRAHPMQHLLAGGIAGFVESSCCHPLDTIKTRMQLRRQHAPPIGHSLRNTNPLNRTITPLSPPKPTKQQHRSASTRVALPCKGGTNRNVSSGLLGTARGIIEREGPFALYKGLTAVYTGIIPKMAIRFVSFEYYRDLLTAANMFPTTTSTFVAGLASGITEAVLVVTPAEVCKIRMQAQDLSLVDPVKQNQQKYKNVFQTAVTLVREEGLGALYKGVVPTMMRQGCNQAANFTTYSYLKRTWLERQQHLGGASELQPFQHLLLGGVSGGIGPTLNNPLDVVKTRMQRQVIIPGQPVKYQGLLQSCVVIAKEEGVSLLWKGLTPRLLRIIPGQAITFMTYEAVSKQLYKLRLIPTVK